nr:sporamin A precursor [Ipomoea batatas]
MLATLHISRFDQKHKRSITQSQTRNLGRRVVVSANVEAFLGAELAISDFVSGKVVGGHLNLELVAIVGDELAGFHEILPGFIVVLDPPVLVVCAELVIGNVESEGLVRLRHDDGDFRVRRSDGNWVADVHLVLGYDHALRSRSERRRCETKMRRWLEATVGGEDEVVVGAQASADGHYGGEQVVIYAGPDFVAVDVLHRSFGRRRFMGGAEADGIEVGMSWVGVEIEGK